jgi:hypothetical protein
MFVVLWLFSLYLSITKWSEWSWMGAKGITIFFLVLLSLMLCTKENRRAARLFERSLWLYLHVTVLTIFRGKAKK